MNRKIALTAIILFVLLGSLVAGLQAVEVAKANFTIPKRIVSPINTIYRVSDVPLDVRIEVADYYKMVINASVNEIFYSLDEGANVSVPFYYTETNANGYVYTTYRGYKDLAGLSEGAHLVLVFYENSYATILVGSVSFIVETVDVTSPLISNLSIENKTYNTTDIPLSFNVNETTSQLSYNLDNQANITIKGNTTLAGLSDGLHNLVIYANDTAGNMGKSDIAYFTVNTKHSPTPNPTPSISPTSSPAQTPTSIPTVKMTSFPYADPPDYGRLYIFFGAIASIIIIIIGAVICYKKIKK